MIAGISGYYDSHYRLYCQFIHAAFRAVTHGLNELDTHDNRTMTICALSALEAIIPIGASGPNIGDLRKRRNELDQQE